MRTRWTTSICTGLGLLLAGLNPFAPSPLVAQASPRAPAPPLVYTLSRVSFTGYHTPDRFWVVTAPAGGGDTAPRPPWGVFKDLAAPELRQWVSRLPQGSAITVVFTLGGGNRVGHPTPAQSVFWADLRGFTDFCHAKKLQVAFFGSLF